MLIFELVKWLRTSTLHLLSRSVILSDAYIILTYSNPISIWTYNFIYQSILIRYFFYYFFRFYPISVSDNCRLYVILRWEDILCDSCRKSIWRDRSEYVYILTKWINTLLVQYVLLRSFLVRYKLLSVDFIEWFSIVWESLNHWMV